MALGIFYSKISGKYEFARWYRKCNIPQSRVTDSASSPAYYLPAVVRRQDIDFSVREFKY